MATPYQNALGGLRGLKKIPGEKLTPSSAITRVKKKKNKYKLIYAVSSLPLVLPAGRE